MKDAIQWSAAVWKNLDFATVRHCWRKAYILPAILTSELEADDESMTRRENIAGKMVGFVGNLTVADVA